MASQLDRLWTFGTRLIASVMAAAVIVTFCASAMADRAPAAATLAELTLSDAEMVVLEARLDRTVLSGGIIAYPHPRGILLPLGEISRLLELAIDVRAQDGAAEGWVITEDRTFSLDLRRREVVIGGRAEPLPAEGVVAGDDLDDIFVDSILLGQWIPADFEVDFATLTLRISPRETFPLQARLEREQRRKGLGEGQAANDAALPKVHLPYQAWSMPFVDGTLELRHEGSDAYAVPPARYSLLATGDLAYLSAEAFLAGDTHEPISTARLRLGRTDPDGALLGPFDATEFALGDVITPRISLVTDTGDERGLVVSNFPIDQPTEFDTTALVGDLLLGWDVELYRNGVLLDFQTAGNSGRYTFENIPLLFGLNQFRLVFYGPQGQIREEERNIFVGPGMIRAGEQHYRASLSQKNTSLFGFDDQATTEGGQGEARYSFEYEAGLTDNLSAVGSVASLPFADNRHNYALAGLRTTLGPVFTAGDLVTDSGDGWAAQATVQTNLLGIDLLAQHATLSDFESERENDDVGDAVIQRSRVRLDSVLPFMEISDGALPPVPISLGVEREVHESGRTSIDVSNRLSVFAGGVSASNTLRLHLFDSEEDKTGGSGSGAALVSGRVGSVYLRGQLGYAIAPVIDLQSAALTADWQIEEDLTTRATISHDLAATGDTAFTLSLTKLFDSVGLGAAAHYTDTADYGMNLQLTFALGREPRSGRWNVSSERMAQSGAVSVRVFLDQDLDGRFTPGDEPLEGVKVGGRSAHVQSTTDAEGIGFITGLQSYEPAAIRLYEPSLPDPFMVPATDGFRIVPRPAAAGLIDFPVVMTGDIEGTVQVRMPDGIYPLPRMTMQLVDAHGAVVRSVQTAFDGYYLFERVRPGRYVVSLDPERASTLELAVPDPRPVEITANGDIVSGVDFEMEPGGPAQVPAEQTGTGL